MIRAGAALLTGLGIACYGAGVALVIGRLAGAADWRLDRDWSNANCILHGALSITGLTVIVGDFLPTTAVLDLWVGVAGVFALVELVELARLWERVRRLGWRCAVAVYDVSQWTRNFTFGMFYAFTLAFVERFDIGSAHPALDALRRGVLSYGAYVVLALLVIELGLLAATIRDAPPRTTA